MDDNKKFGMSLVDEDGFVDQLFYTRDVWEMIIESIQKHAEFKSNDYERGYNDGYQKALADAKRIIMQTK